MKRALILAHAAFLAAISLTAQQTVTIGDVVTKNSAVLYLKGNGNQGIIIPIVTSRVNIASPGAEKGMMVFDDTDDALYYHDGTQWIKAGGSAVGLNLTAGQNITITGTAPNLTISAPNVDAVVGNEITKINTRGGLELTGAGTAASPLTVGLIQGTTDGQILKWNGSTSKWELGTDNTGGASIILANGQILTGNGTTNSATTLIGDAALSGGTLTIATGAVNSSKIADGTIANIDVAGGAAIAGSKITPNFGAQNLSAAIGTFSGNVNIRGLNYTWPAALGAGVLSNDGTGVLSWAPASAGTVTSVGLTMPAIFAVGGSPVTASGTLSATLNSQSAATVFAAPAGVAGVPTFRSLVEGDIPALSTAKITTGTFPLGRIAGAGAGVRAILGSDNNTVSWVTGTPNQLLGTDASGALQFVDKSGFGFTTADVIPKGSATGFVASTLSDNGTALRASNDNVFLMLEDNVNNAFNSAYLSFGYNDGSYQEVGSIGKPGSGNYLEIASPNFIHFNTSFGPRMVIDAAGNVGIGTTTPSYLFEVSKSLGGPADTQIRTFNPTASSNTKSGIRFQTGSGWAVQLQTSQDNNWLELTNNGGTPFHRWTFNSYFPSGSGTAYLQGVGNDLALMGGNVGINTAAPTTSLDVNGSIRSNSNLELTDGSFTYTLSVAASNFNLRYGAGSSIEVSGFNTSIGKGFVGGGTRLAVGNSGDGSVAVANAWNIYSDKRLKKNITAIPYGLETVMQLHPTQFQWITSNAKDIGFIAQEIEQVIPEIVVTNEETGYKTVNYDKVVAVLVQAIQEQQVQIDVLKQQLKEKDTAHTASVQKLTDDLEQIKRALGIEASNKK